MRILLAFLALTAAGCMCGSYTRGDAGDGDAVDETDVVDDTSPDPLPDPVDEDGVEDTPVDPIPDGAELMDADGDTISDLDEDRWADGGPVDTDGDTVPDFEDTDSDGDGVDDADEAGDDDLLTPPDDCDGDGVPNYRDPDSDDDGVMDGDEVTAGTDPCVQEVEPCHPSSDSGDWEVSHDPGTSGQEEPTIVVGPDCTIYVAWEDGRNSHEDIYFSRSTDGGETWTSPDVRVNTDPSPMDQREPLMVMDSSGTLYVVWRDGRNGDYDIYLGRSTDGGDTWIGPDVRVNSDTGTNEQWDADMAVDPDGNLYVAWSETDDARIWGIYFARSTDGGDTWTDPSVRINDADDSGSRRETTIAVDSAGTIHVAWQDERSEEHDSDIYVASSTDGGDTWTDPNVRVSTDTSGRPNEYPEIAVNSTGNVYLIWLDYRDDDGVYFAMSTDGGHTWTDPNVRINDDDVQFLDPVIAVSTSNIIYVAWEGLSWEEHIYMTRSLDSGRTWSDPAAEVDYSLGDRGKRNPAITTDIFGNVYAVWQDQRYDDSYNIYFRVNPPRL